MTHFGRVLKTLCQPSEGPGCLQNPLLTAVSTVFLAGYLECGTLTRVGERKKWGLKRLRLRGTQCEGMATNLAL
jgi:hypothetical protein